ncbi:MAG: CcoQ/FixQ family Cbb3-type cytochrome c oxidase assembly chaperone [Rhodovulum sulfidophilum]|uniref:CcoQ/FixQ family Cbb3-type cytochrome c oxidase assembly chaperone n=1 Tax=Rhodovulum sulfidophilum TaxID=35806 RepID=A0A2W5QE83_RHOSU|nr:MAG: CcoQ/FixQ family Cbb3-type cytochrome c oxidase assembly chaperone [Rhodovulum sulfidophilum]
MENYTFLRQLADSWALLVLVLFFVGLIFWVNRPGSKKVHDEIAKSIFENEDKPKDDPDGK